MRPPRTAPRVGLALGSGGARGWAHLGVLRALEDAGVHIDCVAGTSMGALVGAALAAGRLPELQRLAVDLDMKQVLYHFLELGLPRSGLIDGAKIVKLLSKELAGGNIEHLPIPYRAVAADLATGREVVLDRGDLIAAVRASISIPGMFTPVQRDGRLLVDGGIVNPVPVSVVRRMGARVVVAVNISDRFADTDDDEAAGAAPRDDAVPSDDNDTSFHHRWEQLVEFIRGKTTEPDTTALRPVRDWIAKGDTPNVFDVLGNSFRIMETQLAAVLLANEPPDILIEPCLVNVNFMEFHRAAEIIDAGYSAARAVLDDEDVRRRLGVRQAGHSILTPR